MENLSILRKNIELLDKFDYSVLSPSDRVEVCEKISLIQCLCKIYIDFEKGFNPDKENE